MRSFFKHGILSCIIIAVFQCDNRERAQDPLAAIGGTLICTRDAEEFAAAAFLAPSRKIDSRPENTDVISEIIRTELLCQSNRLRWESLLYPHGKEWRIKKEYYLSQLFAHDILQRNCGYSDTALKKYYLRNRVKFSEKKCSTMVAVPFDSIRERVADTLFLSTYTPDSGMLDFRHPKLFRMFKEKGYLEYFRKKYYRETYGKPFPLAPERDWRIKHAGEIDIVLSWLSPEQRDVFSREPDLLYPRLLEWKLFNEKAQSVGYATDPRVVRILKWAQKIELSRKIISDRLTPSISAMVTIDTAMALYGYWDESLHPDVTPDSVKFSEFLHRLFARQFSLKLDSLIFELRLKRGVHFFQPDYWSDGRIQDPSFLLRKADSLYESGKTGQASAHYSLLTEYYPFTLEGNKAWIKLAAIQAEEGERGCGNAIKIYRRILVYAASKERQCDFMFRIGFIYDKCLHLPEMARINYTWLMKNGIRCEQAQDAEILLQYLGQPFPSIENLRSEARNH